MVNDMPTARCTCGALIELDSFRDARSLHEFSISGLCQACQDDMFFSPSAANSNVRYPLRKGAVAALVERPGGIEVGVLPFVFVAPEARIAWQSHHVVHAGEEIRSLDPWAELFALEREIPRNQIRAVEVADVGGPQVRNALDVELIIVPDAAARRVLARLPAGGAALCVALADDVAWDVVFGEPIEFPPTFFEVGPDGLSVLGVCARLALALGPLGDEMYLTLAWLIGEHAKRFPELLWVDPDARY